ncbi:MAG TPA: hypothetical protein DCQ04_02710, partial [Actinobacteria bacterium]|nr:hypothetical protein [Actinomycetota bacterium]
CSITASQAGDDNYNAATDVTQTFAIGKADQTITFTQPADVTFGVSSVSLDATASSGLTVSFVSNDTSVCTVVGSAATIVGAGACSITASQAGSDNYNPAPDITRTFAAGQSAQTTTFELPSRYSVEAGTMPLTATATSGLTVTFTSQTPSVCAVSGATAQLLTSGICTITAEQAGNANFSAAPPVDSSASIEPLPPQLVDLCSPGGSCADADLAGIDLAGVDMAGIDFAGANFVGANLTGANFTGANLTGANFTGVAAQSVVLKSANLTGANFTGVDLTGISLKKAVILNTDFTGANLRGVDFTKVKYVSTTRGDSRLTLRRVTFTNANLRDTKFAWMKLADVNFTGADLRKAKMKGVIVSGGSGVRANLRSVDLSYATLKNTDYSQADFTRANLRHARFLNVKLAGATLYKAKLGGTKFRKTSLKLTIRGPGGRAASTVTPAPQAPVSPQPTKPVIPKSQDSPSTTPPQSAPTESASPQPTENGSDSPGD